MILTYSAVAFPLDVCHFPGRDINFERTEVTDARFSPFKRHLVMTRRHQRPKMPILIGGKRRRFALFVFHDKTRITQRHRIRRANSDRSRLSWADGDYSFYSRFSVSRSLPGGNARSHYDERPNNRECFEPHTQIYAPRPHSASRAHVHSIKSLPLQLFTNSCSHPLDDSIPASKILRSSRT